MTAYCIYDQHSDSVVARQRQLCLVYAVLCIVLYQMWYTN